MHVVCVNYKPSTVSESRILIIFSCVSSREVVPHSTSNPDAAFFHSSTEHRFPFGPGTVPSWFWMEQDWRIFPPEFIEVENDLQFVGFVEIPPGVRDIVAFRSHRHDRFEGLWRLHLWVQVRPLVLTSAYHLNGSHDNKHQHPFTSDLMSMQVAVLTHNLRVKQLPHTAVKFVQRSPD